MIIRVIKVIALVERDKQHYLNCNVNDDYGYQGLMIVLCVLQLLLTLQSGFILMLTGAKSYTLVYTILIFPTDIFSFISGFKKYICRRLSRSRQLGELVPVS